MILLQIPTIPDNLQIDSLTGWTLVVVIAMYLIYSLTDKYMAKRKTASTFNMILDRLEEQSKINRETMKYLKTISLEYSDELTEEQYRIYTTKFFVTAKCKINHKVRNIIEENNIKGNEDKVTSKVKNFIKTLYISDEIEMRSFKFNGILLSDYMKSEWIETLTTGIIDCIYTTKDESERIKSTQYFVSQEFTNILNHYLNKIK